MINLEYGKSMYGGWYAQSNNQDIALRAVTLKELKEKVSKLCINAKLTKRFDNLGNGIL
jgi:hypothetical protein